MSIPPAIHNVTDEFLDMIQLPSAQGRKLKYLVEEHYNSGVISKLKAVPYT
jgi:hypothetical protein